MTGTDFAAVAARHGGQMVWASAGASKHFELKPGLEALKTFLTPPCPRT
jgi:hypothetical protein